MRMLSADEVAGALAERLPDGGWLTRRQAAWLLERYQADVRIAGGRPERYRAAGMLADGRLWDLYVAPNGAGNLTLRAVPPPPPPPPPPVDFAAVHAAMAAGDRELALRLLGGEGLTPA